MRQSVHNKNIMRYGICNVNLAGNLNASMFLIDVVHANIMCMFFVVHESCGIRIITMYLVGFRSMGRESRKRG